jgi:MFS family permease
MDAVPARQHHQLTLLILGVGALAFALAQTTVIPALTDLQRTFHTSTSGVTWLVTAYFLVASVATPVLGRMGDMFGKERLLAISLALFALGSVVCALAGSLGVLIVGRGLQGLGGGVFPLSFGIVRDEFPRDRVPTGIACSGRSQESAAASACRSAGCSPTTRAITGSSGSRPRWARSPP